MLMTKEVDHRQVTGSSGAGSGGPRVNEEISVQEVRVVGTNGEMIGVLPTREAIQMAYSAGLDLVDGSRR